MYNSSSKISFSKIDTTVGFDNLHLLTLKCETYFRTSWIYFGKCLYELEHRSYSKYKNLRKYSENLNLGYSACKEILQAYNYVFDNYEDLLKNDKFLMKIPYYGAVNKIRRLLKKYPGNQELNDLEMMLFNGELTVNEFNTQLRQIKPKITEQTVPIKSGKKGSHDKTVDINDIIQVLREKLINQLGSDESSLYLKQLDQIEAVLLNNKNKANAA